MSSPLQWPLMILSGNLRKLYSFIVLITILKMAIVPIFALLCIRKKGGEKKG